MTLKYIENVRLSVITFSVLTEINRPESSSGTANLLCRYNNYITPYNFHRIRVISLYIRVDKKKIVLIILWRIINYNTFIGNLFKVTYTGTIVA